MPPLPYRLFAHTPVTSICTGGWQSSCVMDRLFSPTSGAHLERISFVKLTGYDRQFVQPLRE